MFCLSLLQGWRGVYKKPNEEVFPREVCENVNELSVDSNDVCFANESL